MSVGQHYAFSGTSPWGKSIVSHLPTYLPGGLGGALHWGRIALNKCVV